MAISIISGPATVLHSGSATCFMGNNLILKVDNPVDVTVEFSFLTDNTLEDVAVDVRTEGNHMHLLCTNFDRADGRGSAQPVLIGDVDTLLIFLHFRVFLYGRTPDRTLHYTLYAVEKDAVDWEPLAR